MNEKRKPRFLLGALLLIAFILWTVLIKLVDVQIAGPNETEVGFASFNIWFHRATGIHLLLYSITDWLGLIPIFICLCFGFTGFAQLLKRKCLLKVDKDILLLGVYYIIVIGLYLLFEMFPINYRPILIEGRLEASYPSSTTLLVLSVIPTLIFQTDLRIKKLKLKNAINCSAVVFSVFMVIGRLISGVHWATDIIGSVLLSFGLFELYSYFAIKNSQKLSED